MIQHCPWYLLPVGWMFIALVAAGLFAVGYTCSENKFFSYKWLNDVTGIVCMMPMLYSFSSWKKSYKNTDMKQLVNSNLWFIGSSWEWLKSLVYFESSHTLIINSIVLYVFIASLFSIIIYFVGVWGLFKFYLIPIVFYHFVMSLFLKLNSLKASEYGFVDLPKLIEFLTNNCHQTYSIRVTCNRKEFGEMISSLVPSYNLSNVKEELRKRLDLPPLETIKFDWIVGSFVLFTPLVALYGLVTVPYQLMTFATAVFFYFFGGIGITAGYHRLWSHRSYDGHWFTRFLLLIMGTSAFEGSVFTWCNDHRKHHRYTDTDKDPYNIHRSFFYAHMGWLLYKREEDDSFIREDLKKDVTLQIQHDYYPIFSVFLGLILPTLVCGLGWQDWWGGFFFAGVLKTVILMQCTFCINSVAHYFGTATFADERTARDSYLVSLCTLGEGYHNFHHEFPFDYRNGLHFYDYDPGKWFIYSFSLFGLAYNLKRFQSDLFAKGKIQMAQKQLDKLKNQYFWGKKDLQMITMEELEKQTDIKEWILIDGIVYDIKGFAKEHPGGEGFIKAFGKKDATKEYNGTIYNHSTAARNLLDTKAVFILNKLQ